MNRKNDKRELEIFDFVNNYLQSNGFSPTTDEICHEFSIAKSTASKFINRLIEGGMLEKNGRYGLTLPGRNGRGIAPILGAVACGKPILASEDIEGYLTVDEGVMGQGEFFALRAEGDSMINAGISSGDLVYIRRQDSADEGEIVVAIINDEITGEPRATLKRFYRDRASKSYVLHPENPEMSDIKVTDLQIRNINNDLFTVDYYARGSR